MLTNALMTVVLIPAWKPPHIVSTQKALIAANVKTDTIKHAIAIIVRVSNKKYTGDIITIVSPQFTT